ncbi:Gfo/Idh/MocA family protein [Paradevosia shaoguanensis]|uniref:Gfo/Idh/MocA family oxidoreductase n=1 Tax=Paradevosia shaoguanensis TaxID=1335043 RepID=A0AA41QLP8_9HYPH|nr:Gfo/Idh/MocA family oxidoreductase [Paradevosia shaoguanensis]MCF1742687.1 Gfo/Idh/MocA family oxidoreductase [Paradevosia shaoguanensis]MCI0127170.1 Gfo/Idh/MocA family oxidoreductase [Paradevosia shaoguanensis]
MAENGAPRIRLGMVGGGTGAFIGYVHRIAARLDDDYELVAGALSSRPDVAVESGKNLRLADDRIYTSYEEMAARESARKDGIEAVAIVTPNHMHYGPAKAFLEAGIHVICDKPLTSTLEDARALAAIKPKKGAKFLLTHNYTGYPLVRQARELVKSGALGKIRIVQVEYPQDWLTEPVSSKQADWRTDPKRSGAGGAIGDIGTHAYNLARFVTGLKLDALSADLTSFVKGRKLDDNVQISLRFQGGARGALWASQVAVGHENGLKLRVYGEKGSIEWVQANPNEMWFAEFGKPRQLLTRGGSIAGNVALAMNVRIPSGHPEGYLEAFATLYSQFAEVIRGNGKPYAGLLPSLADGVEGMEFITAAVQSSKNDGKWTKLTDV